MGTIPLAVILLWVSFALTVLAAIPATRVPLWAAVLVLVVALLVRR